MVTYKNDEDGADKKDQLEQKLLFNNEDSATPPDGEVQLTVLGTEITEVETPAVRAYVTVKEPISR